MKKMLYYICQLCTLYGGIKALTNISSALLNQGLLESVFFKISLQLVKCLGEKYKVMMHQYLYVCVWCFTPKRGAKYYTTAENYIVFIYLYKTLSQ